MKHIIKSLIEFLLFCIVGLLRIFKYPERMWSLARVYFYTEWKRRDFRSFPSKMQGGGFIYPHITLMGGRCVSVGKHTYIKGGCSIGAWERFNGVGYTPVITIGDGCGIGERAHITAINSITIGNGVLLGKDVTISDNSHGETDEKTLLIAPRERQLCSRGAVVIEDGVWIGDKAAVLSGVTIGRGAVVGACSVVTKNVAPFTVVAGSPAKIIKTVQDNG